jgi:perosamine synthetase
MKRISDLEKKYALEALDNEFSTSKNSIFTKKFEEKFAVKFNSKFAISHCNGTATMHTALAALGVSDGDEVIVPPLTMSSTALAVLHNRSVPVFADVDMKTFNISPESIIENITDKTKAIITVALYGLSPDYDKIIEICKKYNLFLIEDNAECFLGEYKGKYVGEFGHFSSFSFQASKHITCGEGGILLTSDEDLADKARRFSSLGYAGVSGSKGKITRDEIQDPQYNRHVMLGFNYRMSEVQSAVMLGQIERIDELVERRIEVANIFKEVVKKYNFVSLQDEPSGYRNSFWSFSMILNTDNPEIDWYVFKDIFKKNGGDGFYAAWKLTYTEPLFVDQIQNYPGVWQKYDDGLCPNAEFLQKRMIQMKTNYWEIEEAYEQARILDKSLSQYSEMI